MATPTYQDLATLSASQAFLDRVSMAVAYFARYIIGENPATANHQARFRWALSAIQNARQVATLLAPMIVLDSAFTAADPLDFSAMTDATLQPIVEAAINATLLN